MPLFSSPISRLLTLFPPPSQAPPSCSPNRSSRMDFLKWEPDHVSLSLLQNLQGLLLPLKTNKTAKQNLSIFPCPASPGNLAQQPLSPTSCLPCLHTLQLSGLTLFSEHCKLVLAPRAFALTVLSSAGRKFLPPDLDKSGFSSCP